ncbi:MAG TPA: CNNM domain-containing protein [Candidatus Saccharimonadales bacterium]|nr:CNNM domain-containing protein [Candidatus Saccharimonadales bacterium]
MDIPILVLQVSALVGFAAICSGLNVAFMSLNIADLKRKAKLDNTYAQRLLPLRRNAHLTLAAILLTNVAAASATPLVLDTSVNGVVAGVLSTLLLVVFAEITPQALFARNALLYCGKLSWLLKTMIFFTYPLAKPLQLLLDKLFGREKNELHTRHELGLLISEHLGDDASELDEDEVEIIRGALQLSEKRVQEIMTPIRNVYWMTPNTPIDTAAIQEIKKHRWSRIPVFNQQHTACFGLLLMKDLIDVKPDQKLTVDDLDLYPAQVVGSMTALDTLFRKFISGGTHMIPVEKEDQIVGIVTIEDLLEEIVGHEIEDETDRSRRKPGLRFKRSKKTTR